MNSAPTVHGRPSSDVRFVWTFPATGPCRGGGHAVTERDRQAPSTSTATCATNYELDRGPGHEQSSTLVVWLRRIGDVHPCTASAGGLSGVGAALGTATLAGDVRYKAEHAHGQLTPLRRGTSALNTPTTSRSTQQRRPLRLDVPSHGTMPWRRATPITERDRQAPSTSTATSRPTTAPRPATASSASSVGLSPNGDPATASVTWSSGVGAVRLDRLPRDDQQPAPHGH